MPSAKPEWAAAWTPPTFCCRKSRSSPRSISTTKIFWDIPSRKLPAEKAGIIKPGARVVSAAEHLIARVVIRRRCAEQSAFLVEIENAYFLEDVTASDGCFSFTAISNETGVRVPIALQLPGRFQVRNALTALAAARLLAERGAPIDDAAIARGFAAAVWPGRLERISRSARHLLDGTHNPAGAREISVFWEQFLAGRNIY